MKTTSTGPRPKPQPINLGAPVQSTGVSSKPLGCEFCQFRSQSAGFVPDYVPSRPKIAVLLDTPSGDDVLYRRPLSGKAGFAFRKAYLEPLGLGTEDVLVANVLRCKPKWKYPTGPMRRSAELSCRVYDDTNGNDAPGLATWDPNLFVVTFHPADAYDITALRRLIALDLKKAVRLADEGWRPCVLMGTEVLELVAPWAAGKGGAHAWRGHFWQGSWPWKGGVTINPTFLAPSRRKK